MEKETGVTAVIGHGSPCILLRADMDALPIREDNDLDYKSCNGAGHMCGHDSHAAMLLGAAQILKDMESELKGSVKLMFQPGEEIRSRRAGHGGKTARFRIRRWMRRSDCTSSLQMRPGKSAMR